MNVFIIGQKWLGAEVLRACVIEAAKVVGVCAPRFHEGRTDRLWAVADEAFIPTIDASSLRPDAIPEGTDLIISAHSHVFIPDDVRKAARLGAIGYHPSLLPRHRGRDAIRWAIHMKEPLTGGTVYWMNDVADGGPIAAQDWCHIRSDDTPESLWRRELAPMGVRLIKDVLHDIRFGRIVRVPQEEALATWEPSFDRPRFSAQTKRRVAPSVYRARRHASRGRAVA